MESNLYSVITGDIINSTKYDLETRKTIRRILVEDISRELQSHFCSQVIPFPIDVFRGDSWQLLVLQPNLSLRICLLIRTLIRAFMFSNKINTRISIGFGGAVIPDLKVSMGDGDAYIRSGKGLDYLEHSGYNLALDIGTSFQFLTNLVEALNHNIHLVDFISSNWTYKQCYAVAGMIKGISSLQISKSWFKQIIDRSVVSRHLEKAGWGVLEDNLIFFENIFH